MSTGPPEAPASRPIEHDLPCVQCGYNLRTLHPAGRCPECGCSIAQSAYADAFVGPLPWLRRVMKGIDAIAFVALLHIPLYLAAILADAFGRLAIAVVWTLWIALHVLSYRAVYRTSTPGPGESPAEASRRWLARLASAVSLGVVCLGPLSVAGVLVWLPERIWLAALFLAYAFETAAVLEVARGLALRLGTDRIRWRGRVAALLYAGAFVAYAVGLTLEQTRPHQVTAVRALYIGGFIALVIGGLGRLIELARLHAALDRLHKRSDYGLLRG